jgi:hypothetical protein
VRAFKLLFATAETHLFHSLHWYLAIICHPERALQHRPASPVVTPNVTTRTRARDSLATRSHPREPIPPHEPSASTHLPISNDSPTTMKSTTEDEQEVEHAVRVCPATPRSYMPSRPTTPSSSLLSRNAQPGDESAALEMVPTTDSEEENNAMCLDAPVKSPRPVSAISHGLPSISSKNFYEHAESKSQVSSENDDDEEVDQLQDHEPMDVDTAHLDRPEEYVRVACTIPDSLISSLADRIFSRLTH